MSACARHPSVPPVRRCVGCSDAFCGDCAVPTLDASADEGYGVCDACRDSVPPYRWNRFAAGLPDDVGDHIGDALVRPRKALLRAAYGAVPWGGVAAVFLAGWAGTAWTTMLLRSADVRGGVRFGRGVLDTWEPALVTLVFALSMHALQPSGPGATSPVSRSMAIVATAWLPAAIVAGVSGVLSFAMPMIAGGAPWGAILLAAVGVAVLYGVVLAGQGMAVRRGASRAVGIGASAASLVVSLLVLALVVWIRLNPPWGDAWDAAGG